MVDHRDEGEGIKLALNCGDAHDVAEAFNMPGAGMTHCSPPHAPCWPPASLGQHNGLPASIVVTTTLKELEAGAGRGLTGGGTLLPMSDVIRLAGHAHQLVKSRPGGPGLQPCFSRRWPAPLDAHLSPMWVDSVVTWVRSSPHRGVA